MPDAVEPGCMSTTQAVSKIFARCRDCGDDFVAERCADGTIRPVGEESRCDCQKRAAVA